MAVIAYPATGVRRRLPGPLPLSRCSRYTLTASVRPVAASVLPVAASLRPVVAFLPSFLPPVAASVPPPTVAASLRPVAAFLPLVAACVRMMFSLTQAIQLDSFIPLDPFYLTHSTQRIELDSFHLTHST